MSKLQVCSNCKKSKRLTSFHKEKRGKLGVARWCRVCFSKWMKKYYKENIGKCRNTVKKYREETKANGLSINRWVAAKYENIPCMDCNRVFPFYAMDFDHRPGEVKKFGIGERGIHRATSHQIAKVENEIAKCDLVCAICHRIRTHNRRNQTSDTTE